MTHGSLFSGMGGFDLAADKVGFDNKFHCEINPFGRKILSYYWPQSKSYEDIKKTNFTIWEGGIDVLTGGFPCQPYSVAGKRKGKDDSRHLWPEMLRAIREISPVWIVGENVLGIVNWDGGLVFEEVQLDLEAEGYEVQSFILPAASVNAPHKRDRVWFVAYSNDNRNIRAARKNASNSKKERLQKRDEIQQLIFADNIREFYSNTSCIRCDNGGDNREERQVYKDEEWNAKEGEPKRYERKCRACTNGKVKYVTDTEGESSRGQHKQKQGQREFRGQNSGNDATNATSIGGREVLQEIQSQFTDGESINSDNEQNYWEKFPTQAPICDGDDGLSFRLDAITFPKWRTESVKAAGNAIVPQIAMNIFRVIIAYESNCT